MQSLFVLTGNEAVMLQLSVRANPRNMLFTHSVPSVNWMKEMVSCFSPRRLGYSGYPWHQSTQGALNEADRAEVATMNIDHMNSITKHEVACCMTNTLTDMRQ